MSAWTVAAIPTDCAVSPFQSVACLRALADAAADERDGAGGGDGE